ncbi:hypothetical protein HK102_011627, partial [Quaeritorhiza haematococci]
ELLDEDGVHDEESVYFIGRSPQVSVPPATCWHARAPAQLKKQPAGTQEHPAQLKSDVHWD